MKKLKTLLLALIKSKRFIAGTILILTAFIIGFRMLETRFAFLVVVFLGFSLVIWSILGAMKKEMIFPKMADIILKTIIILIVFGIAIFTFAEILIIRNSASDKDETLKNCKYAIVLGCQVNGEVPSLLLHNRLVSAYDFLKNNEDAKIIVSGGKGRGEDISEAEAMRRFLEDKGISADRIIMEDKATDTYQSFKYSKDIVENLEGGSNVKLAVITNDFHLYRSKKLARDFGFESYGISAITPDYLKMYFFAREFVSMIFYWLHI